MTITTYPSSGDGDSADLAALSLTRLFARLEHNLLSPAADLKPLRQSEYQRMRVGANIEYARTNLQALERSLPQIQPLDRRHELQTTLSLKRQTLKRLQDVLDEIQAEAELRGSGAGENYDNDDYDEDDDEGEDLLGTPEEGSTTDEAPERIPEEEEEEEEKSKAGSLPSASDSHTTSQSQPPPTTTTTPSTEPSAPMPTTTSSTSPPEPSSTLRNRNNAPPAPTPATTTSSSLHAHHTPQPPSPSTSPHKLQETEQTLSSHRAEQEELTTSLLSLATQLKTSSQAFHSSLESEKSVLQRAVDGLDRTTGSMEAAERRMGMLRRMTEGKGWWGRMMLYAWIFGLWLVAVLIVFLGPKLRF